MHAQAPPAIVDSNAAIAAAGARRASSHARGSGSAAPPRSASPIT
jgi:hypothetical protein